MDKLYKGFNPKNTPYITFDYYSSLKTTRINLERPYRFVKGAFIYIAKEEDLCNGR